MCCAFTTVLNHIANEMRKAMIYLDAKTEFFCAQNRSHTMPITNKKINSQ